MNSPNHSYEDCFRVSLSGGDSIFTCLDSDSEEEAPPLSPLPRAQSGDSSKLRARQKTNDTIQRGSTIGSLRTEISESFQESEGTGLQKSFNSTKRRSCHLLKEESPREHDPYQNLKIISAVNTGDFESDPFASFLPSKPSRVLDLPDFEDDFYKQLLDWNPQTNKIAVGLSDSVYLWDHRSKKSEFLHEFRVQEELCSLKWDPSGSQLAFGMSSGQVQIWDVHRKCLVSDFWTHDLRIGALDWTRNGLFSGSKDTQIRFFDPRSIKATALEFQCHSHQILNLKASPRDGLNLLSCGNDSQVFVTDLRRHESPIFRGLHEGPVRAIDWSPFERGRFASGGGSTDRMLKIWGLSQGQLIDEVCPGSQVCDIKYGPKNSRIYVGLGDHLFAIDAFDSKSLRKVGKMSGHSGRILNLQTSPKGNQIVSASPDETLRFWDL